MTTARMHLVSLDTTCYYHVITRCVRQAYLCGYDEESGIDYDYRRQWIVDRLRALASVFAVNICSFAVMHTHYHLVLEIDAKQVEGWSDDEVISRWTLLYKGSPLLQRYQTGEALSPGEGRLLADTVQGLRDRLCSLSWFMKSLNEPVARAANAEDKRKGHFWEARFKSQALLDETALLNCMMYVDLNPIRANMAETPEASDHTSVQERIRPRFNLARAIENSLFDLHRPGDITLKPLMPFADESTDNEKTVSVSREDYLQLLDWTGRAIRSDKRGAIPEHLPPVLTRLKIKSEAWVDNCQHFEHRMGRMVGRIKRIAEVLQKQDRMSWVKRQNQFDLLFDPG